MKKLFTLIVAICATTLAWAGDSGSCGENVTYSFVSSTGTLTISGTGAMNDYSYSNVPWRTYSSDIKKVVINNGVTSIGDGAFYGCTGLTSVTIGNGVTSIGDGAFYGCTGLTSIAIPNSVTSIGNYAFEFVKHITYTGGATGSPWGANIVNGFVDGDFVFSDDKKTQLAAYVGNGGSVIIPDGVTSIGDYAFYDCTGLTSVTIPNSVTSIGDYAFYDCTGLTSVTIPNSVTSIGGHAFSYCTGLTSITIPNSVTTIGEDAFYFCYGLTSMTIGNGVTSIGEWAFSFCDGLTSMTVEATNPPLCVNEDGVGLDMPNYNIPLYVPAASVDAYKAKDEWKKFTNIQAIPATGVNEAAAEKSEVKKIIDRNGIIYIEKDGTRYFLNGGKAE